MSTNFPSASVSMYRTYMAILESFLASRDFADAVISSTQASFGGGSYSVELFPLGDWRVLWTQSIGNQYESPGVILRVPPLSDEDYQAFEDMTHDGNMVQALWGTDELEEVAQILREHLTEMIQYE